jgi:hypothetical protein
MFSENAEHVIHQAPTLHVKVLLGVQEDLWPFRLALPLQEGQRTAATLPTLIKRFEHHEDRRVRIGPGKVPRWFEGRLKWL